MSGTAQGLADMDPRPDTTARDSPVGGQKWGWTVLLFTEFEVSNKNNTSSF